ncbi:MAG: hypothetical protein IJR99_03195 [Kiritimatiellae bacterium]|nr:hypothetical protein [Kiritimatiellia bacterium]
MTKMEKLIGLFQKKGILSLQDPVCEGIPNVYFARLCDAGFIERIGHGVYSCPAYSSSEYITNAEASVVIPQGVACLFSALKYHELTLENPHQLHLAVPRGARVPKNELPLKIYHFSPESYSFGIETVHTKDGQIQVYSIEKTLADCFKFRNLIGIDVAVAALKDAKRTGRINHDKLWDAMSVCRMEKVMYPYLESIVA